MNSEPWQAQLADSITDSRELLQLLGLAGAQISGLTDHGAGFPLRVTRYFASLMRPGDPDDPLLRQVLPVVAERAQVPGFGHDPVADLHASPGSGILHKYRGRALLMTTGACAVHCRYCFRRHFPYADHAVLRDPDAVFETLRSLPDIHEIILSGGDPLTLSDRRIASLLARIAGLPQIRRLRIHSRLPVVLPSRITAFLVEALAGFGLPTTLVIHANHPAEITGALGDAVHALRHNGIAVLNQAVLLKSVNDDADTLAELSECLFDIGVLPYYLHLLDPVAGAAHFDITLDAAKGIQDRLAALLPGYLVPRMVRELAGMPGKMAVAQL